mmetsp:Transcript_2533/g.5891  ORF Transcript_2533/g.5891 Transcript_2533/m.5891 type:complete len:213 (-) Transcript_2533:1713-2351(-)
MPLTIIEMIPLATRYAGVSGDTRGLNKTFCKKMQHSFITSHFLAFLFMLPMIISRPLARDIAGWLSFSYERARKNPQPICCTFILPTCRSTDSTTNCSNPFRMIDPLHSGYFHIISANNALASACTIVLSGCSFIAAATILRPPSRTILSTFSSSTERPLNFSQARSWILDSERFLLALLMIALILLPTGSSCRLGLYIASSSSSAISTDEL